LRGGIEDTEAILKIFTIMLLQSITYLLPSLDMIVYLLLAYNISILLGERIRRIVFPCCKFFLLYIYAYVQHKKIMNAELCFTALSHVYSLLQISTRSLLRSKTRH
jgi:hypothetical protein